jgi:uncharacterized membrane protein
VAALLLLAVLAFWVPYFSQLSMVGRYVHFHVATMVAWMGLLIAQPLLMRARRIDLHRAVGKSTYVLMPLIVVTGVLLAHHRLSQPGQLDQPGMLQLLVLQIVSPLLLAGFYAMAMVNRRTPAVHARWMLVTAILLIDPIVARVLIFYFPHHADAAEWLGPTLAVGLTLGLILAERNAPAYRRVFLILLACLLTQTALFYTLGQSGVWRRFALWFVALPLT